VLQRGLQARDRTRSISPLLLHTLVIRLVSIYYLLLSIIYLAMRLQQGFCSVCLSQMLAMHLLGHSS
jgi:hypothetical protein